jgi:hypothetical protein
LYFLLLLALGLDHSSFFCFLNIDGRWIDLRSFKTSFTLSSALCASHRFWHFLMFIENDYLISHVISSLTMLLRNVFLNGHISVNFPNFLLLLIHNFIPLSLWYIHCKILIPLKYQELFDSLVCSLSLRIFYMYLRRMCFLLLTAVFYVHLLIYSMYRAVFFLIFYIVIISFIECRMLKFPTIFVVKVIIKYIRKWM